ncbi:MAG: ABC transporter substrate-binding protein [Gemmatimonadota bacterium]|nr:MAG: ABC transporter substrate-binding protein [Gemmatimonadota bacterium]
MRRVVSLFPTATEIAFAIGAGEQVVGVSHACDYPPEAKQRQAVTKARFDPSDMSSCEIHEYKVELIKKFGSLYQLDESALWGMKAKVLFTQGPTDFSLVSLQGVRATAEGLNPRPILLILNPRHLDDVFDDHSRVGFVLGHLEEAREIVLQMERRLEAVEKALRGVRRQSVAFIQWMDPPISAGFWVPQLIELAGGRDILNTAGLAPVAVSWESLRKKNPDVIVVACEDMSVERVRYEIRLLTDRPGWRQLKAVKRGLVFLGDGRCFTRAGPRLTDGLEALAWALNPNLYPRPAQHVLQLFRD